MERKIYVAMNVFDKISQHGHKASFLKETNFKSLIAVFSWPSLPPFSMGRPKRRGHVLMRQVADNIETLGE